MQFWSTLTVLGFAAIAAESAPLAKAPPAPPVAPIVAPRPAPAPAPIVAELPKLTEQDLAPYWCEEITPPDPVEIAIAPVRPPKAVEVEPAEIEAALRRIADLAPQVAPKWIESVYAVRVTGRDGRGQFTAGGGSAVAVGPAMLHTARHLVDKINGYVVEVEIDGQWVRGALSPHPRKDLAVITLTGTAALHAVPVRVPEYGERVSVYGLKTKSCSEGTYFGDLYVEVGDGKVALDEGQTVVEQGDSGGGVFGDDGALLGTISGRVSDVHSVTSMVPIVPARPVEAVSAQSTQVLRNEAQATQPVQSSCPGGVCSRPGTVVFAQPRRGRRG